MRALPLCVLVACATPKPTAVDSADPPVVAVGDPTPVVMAPATATPPTNAPSKGPQLRTNGDGVVPVFTDDPTSGDDLAPVTVVVFTDYQCPPCAAAIPTIATVQSELGDAKVRLVHKHFPLKSHPEARPAAEAAVAVHQLRGVEAFETFQRLLLDNQASLASSELPRWAAEAGVSNAKLESFLAGPEAAAKVDRDIALAQALDIAGVPEVRINCKSLDDAIDASTLRAALDAELALAQRALRDGTPREAIYRTRCQALLAPKDGD